MSLNMAIYLRGSNNKPVGDIPFRVMCMHGCFGVLRGYMHKELGDRYRNSSNRDPQFWLDKYRTAIAEYESSVPVDHRTDRFPDVIASTSDSSLDGETILPGIVYKNSHIHLLPPELALVRLYIKTGSTYNLNLRDDFNNGRVSLQTCLDLLKHTLRQIPEFAYLIGPCNHKHSIDILIDPMNMRAVNGLLWIIRMVAGYPLDNITPTVITTAAALCSIKPGFALYYLLWLQSCKAYLKTWYYVIGGMPQGTDQVYGSGVGRGLLELNELPNTGVWHQWGTDSLSTFYSGAPPLKTILKFVLRGTIPSEIGVTSVHESTHKPNPYHPGFVDYTSGTGLKAAFCAVNPLEGTLLRPDMNEPIPEVQPWALMADQVTPAITQMQTTGSVYTPDILNQLDLIVLTMTGRRIPYFTKKPLIEPSPQLDMAI